MAIRKDVFTELGGFDEEFFIYGEEEWLAARLVARGLPTHLVPEARARHIGATSTAKTGAFAVEQLYRARILLYYKCVGLAQATYGALLLTLALTFLLVTAPVRRVVRFRSHESATWCRSALRGVWSGWRRARVVPPGGTRSRC
jgi:GT2 family glycosyltransferase